MVLIGGRDDELSGFSLGGMTVCVSVSLLGTDCCLLEELQKRRCVPLVYNSKCVYEIPKVPKHGLD